jgi:hypothetical protein
VLAVGVRPQQFACVVLPAVDDLRVLAMMHDEPPTAH